MCKLILRQDEFSAEVDNQCFENMNENQSELSKHLQMLRERKRAAESDQKSS